MPATAEAPTSVLNFERRMHTNHEHRSPDSVTGRYASRATVNDNWRFRQKSSEPVPSPRIGGSATGHPKGRRASIAGAFTASLVSSNRRRTSGFFDKFLQQFKRATPSDSRRDSKSDIVSNPDQRIGPVEDEGSDHKPAKKGRRLQGISRDGATLRVKSWVRTLPEDDDRTASHTGAGLDARLLIEQGQAEAVSPAEQVLSKLKQTVASPSDVTLQEGGEVSPSSEGRIPLAPIVTTAIAAPVLEALGLRSSFSADRVSELDQGTLCVRKEDSRSQLSDQQRPHLERRQSSFSSAVVSSSRPSTSSIGGDSSKSSLILDPIRTIHTFIPIAIQPDYLSEVADYDDRKQKRKQKGGSLSQVSNSSMQASSSLYSLSANAAHVPEPAVSVAAHITPSPSSNSLKRLSRSLASLGSSIFNNRSNTSLPMKVSGSTSSLGHYSDFRIENRSCTESSQNLRTSMPRSGSRGGMTFRNFGDQTTSTGTLGRHPSRSNPRIRSVEASNWSMSFRQRSGPDDVDGKVESLPSPATSISPNAVPEKTSVSLPTQLATLPPTPSTSVLASKRSRSMDFNLNKGERPASRNQYDRRRPLGHQVIETSTIYSMHETSHTLVSPLGEPEETQGKVNQYHIIRDIGSGAYGRVVLCRNEQDQRYYACKIISKSRLRKKFRWSNTGFSAGASGGDPEMDHLASVKREVAILKKLSKHPNINALVEVLDDGKEDNLYMIFELCEFGPIMKLQLKDSVNPFCEDLARKYFRDVVLGLEYLHSKRIIHRDLKPENLLLKAAPPLGVVQIADFGISSMFEDGEEEPVLDDKNASPLFSPPEACQSHTKQLKGFAVDIWALGVTLYCLVHGRAPWQEESILQLYDKIIKASAEISSTLSPSLQDLLYRMLRKNPDDRITLADIRVHPWITKDGEDPMLPTEENCVFEEVTAEEVENAFQPAMMFVTKIMNKLKGKGGKKTCRTVSAPPTPAAEDISSSSPLLSNLDAQRLGSGRVLYEEPQLSARLNGKSTDTSSTHAGTGGVLPSLLLKHLEGKPNRMRISASVDSLNRMPGAIPGLGLATTRNPNLHGRSRSFAEQGSLDGLPAPFIPSPLRLSATPRTSSTGSSPPGSTVMLSPPDHPEAPSWPQPANLTGRCDSRRHARRASSMNIIDEVPEHSVC
ncbi:hypothetical protein SpCBS45565_g01940 [Spizellomyces sp. 'palustris']|nr:hypothetical protein SpCBS45565_g01940 [Spizellomyces sp. 'palustris']